MSTKIGFLIANIIIDIMMLVSAKKAEGGRALFVFGDSMVDSGNNNYLLTTARADSYPYGIDHPTGRPSGRFSNGLNLPDLISQYAGLRPALPYLSPHFKGQKLLNGANFASAGVGILNDTGIQFGEIIRMFEQLMLFEDYQKRLREEVGEEKAKRIVNGALVLITLGGNDLINNYFILSNYFEDSILTRSRQFSVPNFCNYLISKYRKILMRLFELGARRVVVTGVGPLGCLPSMLAMRSKNGECVPEIQQAAQIFDSLLIQMTRQLNTNVGSDVFITTTTSNLDFITNPERFGFVTTKIACCGQGRFNGMGLCTKLSKLCQNRDAYAYWDPHHLSQRALGFIVHDMFFGTTDFISPMNLSTMMAIGSHI